MATDDLPTILIVDDDPRLSALYVQFLRDDFAVRTVNGMDDVPDQFDDTVDLVLVDRRMADPPGELSLDVIRAHGFDGPVALITTVEPTADIVGKGFDDYLVKPITKDNLRTLVRTLLKRTAYNEVVQKYFAVVSSVASLEANRRMRGSMDRGEYAELCEQLASIQSAARSELAMMSEDEFEALFRDF